MTPSTHSVSLSLSAAVTHADEMFFNTQSTVLTSPRVAGFPLEGRKGIDFRWHWRSAVLWSHDAASRCYDGEISRVVTAPRPDGRDMEMIFIGSKRIVVRFGLYPMLFPFSGREPGADSRAKDERSQNKTQQQTPTGSVGALSSHLLGSPGGVCCRSAEKVDTVPCSGFYTLPCGARMTSAAQGGLGD